MKDKEIKTIADVIKGETSRPFRYKSKEDMDFINAVMNYFNTNFLEGATGKNNITDWWRQRIVCIRSKEVKTENEEGWFPDGLKGRCYIETFFINKETDDQWKERKKSLSNFYASSIAIYHEAIFISVAKRIDPNFKSQIMKSYLSLKEDKKNKI